MGPFLHGPSLAGEHGWIFLFIIFSCSALGGIWNNQAGSSIGVFGEGMGHGFMGGRAASIYLV